VAASPVVGLPVTPTPLHHTSAAGPSITKWSMPIDPAMLADAAAPARTVAAGSDIRQTPAMAAAMRLADAHDAAYFVDAFGTEDPVSIADALDEDLLDLLVDGLRGSAWHRS
jgi:hypothetical protein